MSADEVVTRVRQEANKRLDLARYRFGVDGAPVPTRSTAARPVFFFDAQQIPCRVSLLRKYLPAEVDAAIRDADEILQHKFNLLGYKGLDYGSEIDWHLDAVHGKRAPLQPWFKVPFLDFSQVGDHKLTWELNRHQHLVTLAKAWCFTSEKKYIDEIVQEWYHWQKKNPYPLGINWASALEVAFRSLSWLWVRTLLAGCRELPKTFDLDLLSGLRQNGHYISRFHSRYFSPNTHLLGEAVALLYIGILCPEIPESAGWRKWAWEIVVNESGRQVRPDGVYFEQSLYYHVYALDLFLYARALAARNGFVIPEKLDDVLVRMLDFLFTACECGAPEGFGDDDGGRVFNPGRNRMEHMADPLALGAAEYERPEWGAVSGLTEEAIWIFGDTAIALSSGERSKFEAGAKAFKSGGVYLVRDADPFPQQMMIDAGPMGADTCGHGHADALSIRFSLDGRPCLIDPGTYSYMSDAEERVRFRGTSAHNTMRVDGVDQSISNGPFNWVAITNSKAIQWLDGELFDLFEGQHDGYCRLTDPVLHQRLVFHVKGSFWLVRDCALGLQEHLLETFWHLHPEFQVSSQNGGIAASCGGHGSSQFHLLIAQPSVWNSEVQSGEISPVYGLKQQAPVVRLHARVTLPAECAVLLVPLAAESRPGIFEEVKQDNQSQGLRVYRYAGAKGTHLIFWSESPGRWTSGQWSSDARLFYCRIEDAQLREMALVGGSFAKWQEKVLVSHPLTIERFEWVSSAEGVKISSSADTVSEYTTETALP